MEAFLQNVNNKDRASILTDAESSLESHLMAFAADNARREERVVSMKEIR